MPQSVLETPPPLMLESPEAVAARSALVPFAYEREAWNTIEAGNPDHEYLPHHDSLLTAEQAEAINNYYDIELDFGTHGFGVFSRPPGLLYAETLATQKEYWAARQVVDGLQEGDTLFLEARGFNRQPPKPLTTEQVKQAEALLTSPEWRAPDNVAENGIFTALKRIGSVALKAMVGMGILKRIESSQRAEDVRDGYLSSAWTYAGLLAAAKGVQVRYADYDRFDDIKAAEQTGKNTTEQMVSGDVDSKLQFLRHLRQREKVARNTVKDWALDNLPSADTPPPEGRKPKLVLLFGAGHRDTMVQAFEDLGLKVTVKDLAASSEGERALEHLGRDIQELMPLLGQLAIEQSMKVLSQFMQAQGPLMFPEGYDDEFSRKALEGSGSAQPQSRQKRQNDMIIDGEVVDER